MAGLAFEIRVSGLVAESDLAEVADLTDVDVTTSAATTVLVGEVADQAALLGLLARLRHQGLVITEIRRRPEEDAVD